MLCLMLQPPLSIKLHPTQSPKLSAESATQALVILSYPMPTHKDQRPVKKWPPPSRSPSSLTGCLTSHFSCEPEAGCFHSHLTGLGKGAWQNEMYSTLDIYNPLVTRGFPPGNQRLLILLFLFWNLVPH